MTPEQVRNAQEVNFNVNNMKEIFSISYKNHFSEKAVYS